MAIYMVHMSPHAQSVFKHSSVAFIFLPFVFHTPASFLPILSRLSLALLSQNPKLSSFLIQAMLLVKSLLLIFPGKNI